MKWRRSRTLLNGALEPFLAPSNEAAKFAHVWSRVKVAVEMEMWMGGWMWAPLKALDARLSTLHQPLVFPNGWQLAGSWRMTVNSQAPSDISIQGRHQQLPHCPTSQAGRTTDTEHRPDASKPFILNPSANPPPVPGRLAKTPDTTLNSSTGGLGASRF